MVGTSFSFVTLPNGNVRMYYFTGPGGNPADALLSATSSDGLTWTTDANAVITNATGSPVDSSFVALANGAFRVYYGLFIGLTSPSGNAAASEVLSGVLSPAGS